MALKAQPVQLAPQVQMVKTELTVLMVKMALRDQLALKVLTALME
jgi:hypothetical protein